MPGYPLELFLVAPPDPYSCGICRDILKSPQQCMQGHAYCADCILAHIAINPACPMCADLISPSTLGNCLVLKTHIGRMLTRCTTTLGLREREQRLTNNTGEDPWEKTGCTWIGPLHNQEDHTQSDCPCAPVECPNHGCGLLVQRRRLSEHDNSCLYKLQDCSHCQQVVKREDQQRHDLVCELKLVDCPLSCGGTLPRRNIQEHLITACPLQPVACAHFGCSELSQRQALESHDAQCGHELSACRLCDALVKRKAEKEHGTSACPKRPTACPRECGALVPLDNVAQNLELCQIEEMTCPYATAMRCQVACPGRMPRKVLEAHLADSYTLAAVIDRLRQQATEHQHTLASLNDLSTTTQKRYEEAFAIRMAGVLRAVCCAVCPIGCVFWAVSSELCPIGGNWWAVTTELCPVGCGWWAMTSEPCHVGCGWWAVAGGLCLAGCVMWAVSCRNKKFNLHLQQLSIKHQQTIILSREQSTVIQKQYEETIAVLMQRVEAIAALTQRAEASEQQAQECKKLNLELQRQATEYQHTLASLSEQSAATRTQHEETIAALMRRAEASELQAEKCKKENLQLQQLAIKHQHTIVSVSEESAARKQFYKMITSLGQSAKIIRW